MGLHSAAQSWCWKVGDAPGGPPTWVPGRAGDPLSVRPALPRGPLASPHSWQAGIFFFSFPHCFS